MLGEPLLAHYSEALNEMSAEGFLVYWKKEFRPYLHAAAGQFAPARASWTERLLKRVKLPAAVTLRRRAATLRSSDTRDRSDSRN